MSDDESSELSERSESARRGDIIKNNENDDMMAKLDAKDEIDLGDDPPEKSSRKKASQEKKLAGSKKGKSGSQPLINPIPDKDTVSDQQLRLNILQYKRIFPEEVAAYDDKLNIDYLSSLSTEELKLLFDEIRIAVGCANSQSYLHHAYWGGCSLVEGLAIKAGLPVQGFANTVSNNAETTKCINEIALETGVIYVRPEMRLMMGTLASLAIVLRHNMAALEKIAAEESKKKKENMYNLIDNSVIEQNQEL